MANQEDRPLLSQEQMEQLARELADAITKTLARSTALDTRRKAGYICSGEEFNCLIEYDCHFPHDCINEFDCPGKFTCTKSFGG